MEVELAEETALVQMGLSQLARRLEQVAQECDPLAEVLQQELGRASQEAYLKDWKTFARWLEATAGYPQTFVDHCCPLKPRSTPETWQASLPCDLAEVQPMTRSEIQAVVAALARMDAAAGFPSRPEPRECR